MEEKKNSAEISRAFREAAKNKADDLSVLVDLCNQRIRLERIIENATSELAQVKKRENDITKALALNDKKVEKLRKIS